MIGIVAIAFIWLMFKIKSYILRVVIVMFFLVWQGLPIFNIWQTDKLVDHLCAKDGGIKIYEVATLPNERFNEWGQFVVADKSYAKPDDEYYSVLENIDILGKSQIGDSSKLVLTQYHFLVYRATTHKVLGEGVSYARRGGDAIGPWMPSSYSCPEEMQSDLFKHIFLKSEK